MGALVVLVSRLVIIEKNPSQISPADRFAFAFILLMEISSCAELPAEFFVTTHDANVQRRIQPNLASRLPLVPFGRYDNCTTPILINR
jgi:hypothetical protein